MDEKQSRLNRREYIRLDTVFPVQFRVSSLDGKRFFSSWQQGFTNNIGKGGICLRVNNFDHELTRIIQNEEVLLSLEIEIPFGRNPVNAVAKVSWIKNAAKDGNKYIIGLKYEQISLEGNMRIMRYVQGKKIFMPLLWGVVFLLAAGILYNGYLNIKLVKGNKALVGQLVKILQESSIAKQKIKEISNDREDLQLRIQALQFRIQTVEEEKGKLVEGARLQEAKVSKRMEELNSQIELLVQEKSPLQEKLIALQHRENAVTEELLQLGQKKEVLEKANFDKMYQWLSVHQNPRTGLVMSFEGDSNLTNWAFIYDQSLVAQAFAKFSDFERVRKILDFFAKKAKRREGLFFNAYYVNDGSPCEYIVHSGPNIWLAIAIAHFTRRAQDNRYLYLAEEIAQAIMQLQDQDGEGGIKGGPGLTWYSTEHNLDAYAFFEMLYQITKQAKYKEVKDKILSWLVRYSYDRPDVPIMRGKGDSTIATDTYAWSIAALGPEKLTTLGMNVDKIIEFAEKNCTVEVAYERPEGTSVKIKGFDFASQKHIARGGVVSSEWTAQMVLSLKIIADFYQEKGMIAKARSYDFKADEYLAGLSNMIISSPSPTGQGEGCLPYASIDAVDTGHGWITPQGKFTGSLSGTAYTLFAYYNYNPLELEE